MIDGGPLGGAVSNMVCKGEAEDGGNWGREFQKHWGKGLMAFSLASPGGFEVGAVVRVPAVIWAKFWGLGVFRVLCPVSDSEWVGVCGRIWPWEA